MLGALESIAACCGLWLRLSKARDANEGVLLLIVSHSISQSARVYGMAPSGPQTRNIWVWRVILK